MIVLELSQTVVPVEIKSVFFKFIEFNILLFCYLYLKWQNKGENLILVLQIDQKFSISSL